MPARAARRLTPFALLAGLLAPAAAGAQSAEPEAVPRLDPVVVTVTRMEQKASEAPAAVTVLTGEDLRISAGQTLDNVLRQVPGFSLFRRSSSVVGHPTTQGVSLRGIGPSGTSRALVLLDDVPINDPFGGWVYWNRIPLAGIERIEVVRGGGSSVWGNYALGGVVHIVSRRPTERGIAIEASAGTGDTMNFDILVNEVQGPVRLSFEGSFFDTGGYPVVKESRRGSIDIDAESMHGSATLRVDVAVTPDLTLFLSGNLYGEDRGNGTPLQINTTQAGALAVGGRLENVGRQRVGDGALRPHPGLPEHVQHPGRGPELRDPRPRPAGAVLLGGRLGPVEPAVRRARADGRRGRQVGRGGDERERVRRHRLPASPRGRRRAGHHRRLRPGTSGRPRRGPRWSAASAPTTGCPTRGRAATARRPRAFPRARAIPSSIGSS